MLEFDPQNFKKLLNFILWKYRFPNMWRDQEEWVECQQFSILIFMKIYFSIKNATFWSKPRHNQTTGSRDIVNLWTVKTMKNKGFAGCTVLYFKINIPDIRLIPLDHVTYVWTVYVHQLPVLPPYLRPVGKFHTHTCAGSINKITCVW